MDMLAIVVPVFAVIATGLIAVRTGLVPASIASGLVTFSYFVCVPSLMFSIVARYPLDGLLAWDFWLLFGAGSLLALFVLRYAGGRLLGPDERTRAVSALAAVMANTGFVALPVLYAIFGEAGVPSAAIANIVIAAVLIPAGVVLLEATGAGWDRVRQVTDRLGHDLRYSVDITKIANEPGYAPEVPFEVGLADTVQWYRDNESWWRPLKEAKPAL